MSKHLCIVHFFFLFDQNLIELKNLGDNKVRTVNGVTEGSSPGVSIVKFELLLGLPGGFLKASWGLPGGFLGASWELPGSFLGTFWGLPEGFLKASWGLPGGFLEASWGLPAGSIM